MTAATHRTPAPPPVRRAQALLSQPLALLRAVPLIIFIVLSKLAATERAKRRLWQVSGDKGREKKRGSMTNP